GLRDVGTSFDEGLPELRVVVDRQRAAALGITPAQVAQTVRTAMVGQTVTQFRDAGTEVDVTIRLDDRSVADRTAIAALPVPTAPPPSPGPTSPASPTSPLSWMAGPWALWWVLSRKRWTALNCPPATKSKWAASRRPWPTPSAA